MNYSNKTQITLVGVSENTKKYGHKIFKDLLAANYDVVGINPKGSTILNQKIYKSLQEVNRNTQLLIMVVPPQIGINVIKEANKLGIKNVWLQPGAQSDVIIKYATTNNINLTYNKCFMVEQNLW